MAAVIHPTSIERAPRPALAPTRPPLRVIDGGRSRAQLARRQIHRRRRIGVLVVLALVSSVIWLAVVGATSLVGGPPTASSTSAATAAVPPVAAEDALANDYVVRPGDTLWVIARQLVSDGDIRPVVDELADRAGGPALEVGQRIDVRDIGG